MPSKSKKHSKTQSGLSGSYKAASPQTPSNVFDISNIDVSSCLEEASIKYPFLIGKSAIIGEVNGVVSTGTKGFKIWLSESSMTASSLTPGSMVSVSLASSKMKSFNGCPLNSLADQCAKCFHVDIGKKMADQVGNYFAIATVLSSSKVMKNGVQLSSNLSYTMGSPISGTIVFIYPIQYKCLSALINGNEKSHITYDEYLPVYNCKELYLELASLRNGLAGENDIFTYMNTSSETSSVQPMRELIGSPKTPMHQSKLSSLNTCQFNSPMIEDPTSDMFNNGDSSPNLFDIKNTIEDDTSNKLLQTCAVSWLLSHRLLLGNIVTIPVLSYLCFFQVIGAKKGSIDSLDQDPKYESGDISLMSPVTMEHLTGAFLVNHETKVYITLPPNMATDRPLDKDLFNTEFISEGSVQCCPSKLGGLSKEYTTLKGVVSSIVADTSSRFGVQPGKCVLLHGPPGTGKTSLAQLCGNELGVNFFTVNGPEFWDEYHGEIEQALTEVFDSARRAAPSLVFIEDLDEIASLKKDGDLDLSENFITILWNLMDGISRTDRIVVIAATNRHDDIDPSLRRHGRLDKEVEIGVPSADQRLDILQALLGTVKHSLTDVQVEHLARVTHGFVGADLSSLCNEATKGCLRRHVKVKMSDTPYNNGKSASESSDDIRAGHIGPEDQLKYSTDHLGHTSSSVSNSVNSKHVTSLCVKGMHIDNVNCIENGEDHILKVAFEDFEKAMMVVKPSTMREVNLEVPKVNWEDVGGQREAKAQLKEAVEWPQKHWDVFERMGPFFPKGVLMFGPPGCSKTLMARAVATEAGLNFLAVKGSELLSKWVGESEKAVKALFAKGRAMAPSIIFFDEIDGLAGIRGKGNDGVSVSDRVVGQLLQEMDGLHPRAHVTVIAATNRPDNIDRALLRPGRFDRRLYVGPPDERDREEIFCIHLRKVPCSSDVNVKELACLTDGYTGADIALICREAAISALEENIDASEITMPHFMAAIKLVGPSDAQSYQELCEKFLRLVNQSGDTGSRKKIEQSFS